MTGALLYVLSTCKPSDGWRAGRETLSSAGMFVSEWWEGPPRESSLSIISLIMSSSSSWLSEVEWPLPPSVKGCWEPRGRADRDMERCNTEGSGDARRSPPRDGINSNLEGKEREGGVN